MIKKLLLFVVAAVLSSCASSGPGAGTKPPKTNPSHIIKLTGNPDFRSMDEISKAFGNKVKITNDEKGKGKDLLDLFSSGFFLLEEYIKNSEDNVDHSEQSCP
jgi:type IV pilus biogenesis protein CpaD/CtpE